ncbi:hypothetical protein ACVTMO_16820 [Pseudomonas segetis]
MTDTKFTPGPWVARGTPGQGFAWQKGFAIDFNEDQEQVVDYVYEEADAHLIAAAPAMYAMLEKAAKAMWASAVNMDVEAAEIEELLAKARGES